MSEKRTSRKLDVWRKVEECEKSLMRVKEVDARVNKLVAVEKLLKKRDELNKT